MEWTGEKLKTAFLKFFEERGHKILPSSSVVPKNDPTLLFTNSGMVQFKNIFLGSPSQYSKVCTSQRCIRAGGKHNDLDDVGKDNYHHTFFEMLGNWSFGDYFKAEAIEYAYEFLVNELGLNKDNLYVTIYEEMDTESRALWSRYFDNSRILAASYKDNFWEMGEFGPCGPCTEIHYDRIGNRDASDLVNKDDPNVLEIWNIVFMEYSKTPEGLFPLEKKNIDTGIGLERLLSILIGADSNYKIDSFKEIIGYIESQCSFRFEDRTSRTDVAFRVLADHSRTMAVCLHDEVVFSNVGVGYVLRRILRRAVRYAHDVLSLRAGVLSKIVSCAAKTIGLSVDASVIDAEESLFLNTLRKGLAQFNRIVESRQASGEKLLGPDVFLLYDTYGFPKDLTELMARERSIDISMEGWDECQKAAKERSKAGASKTFIKFDFGKTDDKYKYTDNNISAKLMAVISSGSLISKEEATVDQGLELIFDRTCFYGEKGGQVGDEGLAYFYSTPNTEEDPCGIFEISDTQIIDGYVHHIGLLVQGRFSEYSKLYFNENNRAKIRANHSTAHILYFYLRSFLKTEQKGSLVDSEKCRFDFNGPKLSEKELQDLEENINSFVRSNASRTVTILTEEEARADPAIGLENEDYSQGVRVIEFSNGNVAVKDACSGTHVESTEEIKLVKIISEGSVKAGIRRIVAVTRDAALAAEEKARALIDRATAGEVFPAEGQIPLLAKLKLRELLKANQAAMQRAAVEKVHAFGEELRKGMKETTELLTKQFEELEDFSSAQVSKIIQGLGKILIDEQRNGVVSVPSKDSVFIALHTEKNEELKKALCEKFGPGNFKISKNIVTGSVRRDDYPEFIKFTKGISTKDISIGDIPNEIK